MVQGSTGTVVRHIVPAFEDYRGTILNVLSGREVRHVAVITQAKGTVRGNHYHLDAGGTQWLYLLSGQLEAVTVPIVNHRGLSRCFILDEDIEAHFTHILIPRSLLALPPWTAHAFRAVEDSTFLAIDEFPQTPDRYEAVTKPWKLIPDELRV